MEREIDELWVLISQLTREGTQTYDCLIFAENNIVCLEDKVRDLDERLDNIAPVRLGREVLEFEDPMIPGLENLLLLLLLLVLQLLVRLVYLLFLPGLLMD